MTILGDLTVFQAGMEVLIVLLSFSLVICFYRLIVGPDVPNRTVAFDLIAVHTVGIFALFAVRQGSPLFLDGAVVTAVLGFLGTVMFARYLEQAGTNETE